MTTEDKILLIILLIIVAYEFISNSIQYYRATGEKIFNKWVIKK